MSRTRAYRRHKLNVKKKNCTRYGVAGYWWIEGNPQTDKRIIGKVATTPKACNCQMCANHTKHHGENFSTFRRKQLYADQE